MVKMEAKAAAGRHNEGTEVCVCARGARLEMYLQQRISCACVYAERIASAERHFAKSYCRSMVRGNIEAELLLALLRRTSSTKRDKHSRIRPAPGRNEKG